MDSRKPEIELGINLDLTSKTFERSVLPGIHRPLITRQILVTQKVKWTVLSVYPLL